MNKFKNGQLVNIKDGTVLAKYNPWTVLDAEREVLGSKLLDGHSAHGDFRGTKWEGHCYYIPRDCWFIAKKPVLENK